VLLLLSKSALFIWCDETIKGERANKARSSIVCEKGFIGFESNKVITAALILKKLQTLTCHMLENDPRLMMVMYKRFS